MSLNVGFALVPGPDGRKWVTWQMGGGDGIVVTVPGISPDDIDAFADQLCQGLKDAGAQARRENSGIVMPDAASYGIDPSVIANINRLRSGASPPPR